MRINPLVVISAVLIGFSSSSSTSLRGAVESMDGSNWLKSFSEYKLLDVPIIPATHNSCTANLANDASWGDRVCYPWFSQQKLSVAEQLKIGIRLLDLRLHPIEGNVFVSHTRNTDYTLDRVLEEVRNFLQMHKSEFVILFLRIDWDHRLEKGGSLDEKNWRQREMIREKLVNSGLDFSTSDVKDVTVKQLAGKVLLYTPLQGSQCVINTGDTAKNPPMNDFSKFEKFDIWDCDSWRDLFTVTEKQAKLDEHMRSIPTLDSARSKSGEDNLHGVAIDLTTVWTPRLTSPGLNDWFLQNLESNDAWKARASPLGVLEIDFAEPSILKRILDYNKSKRHSKI